MPRIMAAGRLSHPIMHHRGQAEKDAEMQDHYNSGSGDLMLSTDGCPAYTSIGTTGAELDHDTTALSMHAQQLAELIMLKSEKKLHHRYYLIPHTDGKVVDENIARLVECYPIEYHPMSSLTELFMALGDRDAQVDSIVIDAEVLYEQGNSGMLDIMNTLTTIVSCRRGSAAGDGDSPRTIMMVSVGRKTPVAILRELARVPEIDIMCMRGDDSSFDEVKTVIEHLLRGEHYVAESIKQMMRKPRKARPGRDGIYLTPRQQQVLDLIKTRGSSNKQIARLLNLSESTVKLHIGQILKKYGCINRTQLALTAAKQKP
jgi:DNA-binding NarL/FixJ family response regulator